MQFHSGGNEEQYFHSRLGRVPLVLSRFNEHLSFEGKKVLDIGSGYGSMSAYAAKMGATSVVGIDLDSASVDISKSILERCYPEFSNSVCFHNADISEIDERGFDVAVSMAVFEHVLEPTRVLREARDKLRSGAEVFLGIGPLYKAPWGDHRRLRAPGHRIFPWAHLLFDEEYLIGRRNKCDDIVVSCIEDLGLNKFNYSDYVSAFEDCGLRIKSIQKNCHENKLISRTLNKLIDYDLLHDLLCINLYVVLVKD